MAVKVGSSDIYNVAKNAKKKKSFDDWQGIHTMSDLN